VIQNLINQLSSFYILFQLQENLNQNQGYSQDVIDQMQVIVVDKGMFY
jgi:hypothetical protein